MWIRACVFSGSLSVLINGNLTEEINIQHSLKQGDPLAPFLFLLVAEGLNGLVISVLSLGVFQGFRVGPSGFTVSHLQYTDDALFIEEPTVGNMWAMKSILRSFELMSGLKVNFSKSSLIGVNVDVDFLPTAEGFLHCKVATLPFKYLGLPVGGNPRKASTWAPLVDGLLSRLAS